MIGAYAAGLSTDLLTNTLLATRAPVLVCPAMHTEMWEHPAVEENIATLRRRGVHVVEPEVGRLAGGDVGAGRLADPAEIVAAAERILGSAADLAGLQRRRHRRRHPRADRRRARHRQPQLGQAGLRHRRRGGGRGAEVTLVSTVDLPAPPASVVAASRRRPRCRRPSWPWPTPTSS